MSTQIVPVSDSKGLSDASLKKIRKVIAPINLTKAAICAAHWLRTDGNDDLALRLTCALGDFEVSSANECGNLRKTRNLLENLMRVAAQAAAQLHITRGPGDETAERVWKAVAETEEMLREQFGVEN